MLAKKILLLEDDVLVGEQIEFALQANQMSVVWVKTIEECRERLSESDIGLAIFDVNIGSENSIDFLSQLKSEERLMPTIFLSANGSSENIVRALELGANDFIHKPINNSELMLRVKTHLRLLKLDSELSFEGVEIDPEENLLTYNNINLSLSDRQKDLMVLFFKNPNKILKRKDIFMEMEKMEPIDVRTIDSHISQIRRRLREKDIRHISIESVYRVGYRLTNNAD